MGFHGHHWTDEMRASRNRHLGSVGDRFARLIEPDLNTGCWLWSGTLIKATGYGQIQIDSRVISAHRLAYEIHKGPIPAGLHILHRCDTPACVNPDHLRAGTSRDNVRDMIIKGRRRVVIGDAHTGAKIKAADVPAIRARIRAGESNKRIARDYGVTDCAINALKRGRTWWHVPDHFDGDQGGGETNKLPAEAAA